MSTLMKRSNVSNTRGAVSGVASWCLPGLGQLINGEGDKALGMFAVWGIAGLGFLGVIPVIGTVAGLVAGGTMVVAAADGYIVGRRK